jgi:uncharacterized membrane protein YdjX (TVP38/TMEM64 family)
MRSLKRLLTRRNIKSLLGLFTFGAILLVVFYASIKIDQSRIEHISTSLGAWGILFLALCILATQIFSFLSSTPVLVIVIRLYGYPTAVTLLYIVTMVSAVTNFWTARIFGRPVVRKLVGARTMVQIDMLTQANERSLLTVARLFGYFFVDVIGYALGLTSVDFSSYMIYTAALTLIPTLTEYVIFRHFTFNTLSQLIFYYGYLAMSGALFIYLFYRIYIRGRRNLQAAQGVSEGEPSGQRVINDDHK